MTCSRMTSLECIRRPGATGTSLPLSLRLLAAGYLFVASSCSWASALYQTGPILELTDTHDLYIQDHSLLVTRSLSQHLYLTARHVLNESERLQFAENVLQLPAGKETRHFARQDARELGRRLCPDLHAYETAKSRLPAEACWRFAIVALHGSGDPHVRDAALDDLAHLQTGRTEALAVAENAVEAFQLRVEPNSDLCRKAVLVQARLLLLLNQREEAIALFETAINSRWPDAVAYYIRTIRDVVDITPAYMVELYLNAFESPDEDLYWFFRNMVFPYNRTFKTPAMDDVHPFCIRNDKCPEYEAIARAACLIVDGRIADAQRVLETLDKDGLLDKEYHNNPIYRIIALTKLVPFQRKE